MVGKSPPVWHDSSRVIRSTNDAAKDEAQATPNMRDQRRSHASATWWAKKREASRAFACASCQTNCTASSLHHPRVSVATTTRRQRVDGTNSGYVVSLSILRSISVQNHVEIWTFVPKRLGVGRHIGICVGQGCTCRTLDGARIGPFADSHSLEAVSCGNIAHLDCVDPCP